MKICEYERLFTGLAPAQVFPWTDARWHRCRSIWRGSRWTGGSLDIDLIAPLWAASRFGPLACHLLDALNRDAGTLFRRIAAARDRQRRKAGKADPAT